MEKVIRWWVHLNSRLHRYVIVEHVITEPSALICCNSPGSLNFLLKANLKARLETGCIVCVCSLWGSYFHCFALIKLSLHSITRLNPKSSQAAVSYDISFFIYLFFLSLVSEPSKLNSDWKAPSHELTTMWSVQRTWNLFNPTFDCMNKTSNWGDMSLQEGSSVVAPPKKTLNF